MYKKPLVMALILTIASAGVGTSYAVAFNRVIVNSSSTPVHGVNFSAVSYSDNESGKDVGDVVAIIVDTQSIVVTITNGYPGYAAYVDFTILNTGTKPIFLDFYPDPVYDTDALFVKVEGFSPPIFLFPGTGNEIVGHLTVEVLQGAAMGGIYTFNIVYGFSGTEN